MRRTSVFCLFLSACSGSVGDPSEMGTDGGPGPGPGPREDGGTVVVEPPPPPPFAPAPGTLQRLTRARYLSSVQDLLGPGLNWPTDLEVDTPLFGFTSVGASTLTIGPRAAEQYEAAALSLAHQIFTDATRREAFVGCVPSGAADPCVRSFLGRFGERAFRRPLSGEELDRWQVVVTNIEASLRDVWTGLELATAGLLQSPYFLYRVEVGSPDPADATRYRYDGYELATRLAYFVWGSTPDDELLAAAGRGDLDTTAGIEAQTRRLLSSPRSKDGLLLFFFEHLKLDRLEGLTKSPTAFPQFTPAMGPAMRDEILRLVEAEVLGEGGDFRRLLTSQRGFINDDLARIYFMPSAGPQLTEVNHPANSPRRGILTTAGFLALNAHETISSPTYRGRYIRQSLLCQDIPPPPANVNPTVPEAPVNSGPQTFRQRLEALHLSNPTCAGCHQLMDPLGFGLEGFDAIGAYRTTDNGLPINASGTLDGRAFKNAAELAEVLADHRDLGACLAKVTYRHATGHKETTGETRTLRAVTAPFVESGYQFDALVVAIATSDGFRYAKVPE
jgi:hypothetical protein